MLRRLHTRIVGMGSLCGMAPSPPAELFLKSLPPPREVDYKKYTRFEREERERHQASPCVLTAQEVPPEPFYDIQCGAAEHKHVVLMTREGNLITFGDNQYGQTAAPREERQEGPGKEEKEDYKRGQHASSGNHRDKLRTSDAGWSPLYVDLNGAFPFGQQSVACGSNYTIVYCPGGRRAIAFGNNHMGQLGIGHKNQIDSEKGFCEWNPTANWWGNDKRSVIRHLACGFNHAVLQLTCGSLLSFGSNTWGELGIGSTVSPMEPTRIQYFEKKGIEIAKVAAGNSFSLFLSNDGRVYGCGATNSGQLPQNEFEPVPLPLTRSFLHGNNSSGSSRNGDKLIRIKDIACVGTMAVFLSSKNELLVQGALPDYGFQVSAPRLEAVNQQSVIDYFRAKIHVSEGNAKENDSSSSSSEFDIAQLIQGPSTLLVVYRNGCVAGLGANTEGQLQHTQRTIKGKTVNLAKAFVAADGLLPVLLPTKARSIKGIAATPWLACGSGFTLLFDKEEAYCGMEGANPIELPPAPKLERPSRH